MVYVDWNASTELLYKQKQLCCYQVILFDGNPRPTFYVDNISFPSQNLKYIKISDFLDDLLEWVF